MCVFLLSSTGYPAYRLQFLSSKTKQGAEEAVKELTAKGAQSHILVQESADPSTGTWYKVRTALIPTLDEAVRQKKRLGEAGLPYKILIVQSRDERSGNGNNGKHSSPNPSPARAKVSSMKEADGDRRDVTLTWDPVQDDQVTGYRIYYDTTPGPVWDPDRDDLAFEGRPPIDVKKEVNELTLHGLRRSKDYYFSVTAHKKGLNVETAYANGIIAPAVEAESSRQKVTGTRVPMSTSSQKVSSLLNEKETGEKSPIDSLIAPGDVIEINVPGQREMSRIYDVDPDGNIYIVLVGRVKTSGANAEELSDIITETLKTFVSKGDKISVLLVRRERYVQIQEGVRYPGWYRVPQKSHINDLIDMAGGLLAGADYSRIVLKRKTPAGSQEIPVRGEISLAPDDLIHIPFPKGFDDKIDSGDLIYVSIPEKQPPVRSVNVASMRIAEEAMQNRIEVDRGGFLHIPQYGEFYINNMTPKEVRQLIMQSLPKYLADDSAVEVNIVEKKHSVQVLGHVAKPGFHNVRETDNLQEVLARAGGAIDGAVMSEISIQREWGGLLRSLRINLHQYNITGDPRLLTPIHTDDVIHVPISSVFGDVKRSLNVWTPPPERLDEDLKSKFKVFGAVYNPGTYEPREDMTLLEALVLAGGETSVADLSRILIIRNGKVQVKFNMEQYLEGKGHINLPTIMRGDTVYVTYARMTVMEPKQDQVFFVLGEVKNSTGSSGEGFKLKDGMTVIHAIALAGGPTDWANVKKITIIRNVAGKQENIPYNLERAIAGKYPEINIYVQPNDVIYVP